MNEWKEYKLGEIAEIISERVNISYATVENYISTENMINNFGGVTKAEKLPIASSINRFQEKDVLFSNIRTYFKKVWKSTFNGTVSPDVLVFREKKGIVKSSYLFYLLCNPDFTEYSVLTSRGAKMPRGDKDALLNYTLNLPPLPEQKAIACILSSLDDKIDLLHRQNTTLENMAETLFRQWFVEEAKEDWEEVSLFDAIELVGGGTPKTSLNEYWNGNIKWLSGGDISSNHKNFVVSSEKTITELGLRNSSAKLLPKFSTVISARGTVGKYCLLSEPMAYSQSNYGILPKFKDCFFFTYLLVSNSVDELQSAAYGSVFDTITTNTFKGLTISLPEEEYIIQFNKSIEPYFSKILTNQIQIRTLTSMRDTLLPKLMSGEVRVKM